MSLSDDELKKLRERCVPGGGDMACGLTLAEDRAIIDEALSRGAQRDSDSDAFILALTDRTRERDEARAALEGARPADPLARLKEDVVRAAKALLHPKKQARAELWDALQRAVERLERKRR